MSEAGDYDPGPWAGRSFSAAKAYYDDDVVQRSYSRAKAAGKKRSDLVPESICTQSTCPFIIATDITGSMDKWPGVIFSKLPYLDHEARTEYLGEDMEICFIAFGDANEPRPDEYPVQVRPFAKGTDLEEQLKQFVMASDGGGQMMENYELAGIYCARNVEMPKAVRPILIFIGDEAPYSHVSKDQAEEIARVSLKGNLSTEKLFDELKQKYTVYFIQKPYGSNTSSGDAMSPDTLSIYRKWAPLIGEDHIAALPEAGRVVDVIFGILAKESGKVDYFEDELKGRQTKAQVATVMKSLKSIHAALPNPDPTSSKGRSKLISAGKSKATGKTKPLA